MDVALRRPHYALLCAVLLYHGTVSHSAAPPRDSKVPQLRRPAKVIRSTSQKIQESRLSPSGESASPKPPVVDKVLPPIIREPAPADPSGSLEQPVISEDGTTATKPGESLTPSCPDPDILDQAAALELQKVLDSVYSSYPLLEIAILDRVVKEGAQVAALGEFDLKLKAESTSAPMGYYRNTRNSAGIEQPLWQGGNVDFGYQSGLGVIEPWYGFRQTNDGGTFKAGIYQPWLRNFRMDDRRAELFKRQVDRNSVEPFIQVEFLTFIRDSSIAYWGWIGAGRVLEVNRRLLSLADQRTDAIAEAFRVNRVNKLLVDDNQRLVVGRKAKVVQSEQKVREAAIKLSLFLRTAEGRPFIARADQLLPFPDPSSREQESLAQDVAMAIERRPELRQLQFDRQRFEIEFDQARNLFMPQLDSFMNLRQGVGAPNDPNKNDKGPFAIEAGIIWSTPYQRRKGLGKMQEVRGKLSQINFKIGFQQDKITSQVQTAVNSLQRAYERVQLAREAVQLSEELAEAERERFRRDRSDLLDVNLREDAVANAQIVEIEALFDYFVADADLRFALASDVERIASRSVWAGDSPNP
ncbi:TolC family protein [bacterium]|nr:TolC family protein [bacterium]